MPTPRLLPTGKLDPELLRRLLPAPEEGDPRVILGPGIGCDVAVLDFGETALLVKSDPVTFATDALGWYAVNVNANDIATAGGTPRWFLATLLLPEGRATAEMAEGLFAELREACAELGVALIGGHTEVTYGLDRPIICGQMLGEVARERLVLPSGIRVGDAVLMTKSVAIEGTSLLAREVPERLLAGGCSPQEVAEAVGYLFEPGISVVADARALTGAVGVHAMHDPTEGGLATGLWEMAEAGGVGIDVWPARISRLPLADRFCEVLGLNPLGLIASGTLLAAVAQEDAHAAVATARAGGIDCMDIGTVTDRRGEVREWTADGWRPLRRFDQDEVAKVFA